MSLPSGFKSREEYNAYMKEYNRKYREQNRQKVEQGKVASDEMVKAKIEEMTFKTFGDMEFSWCVEARMHDWKESKEDAEKYCTECRQDVRAVIALDMAEKAKIVEAVPSVVQESVKKRVVDADLLASCVKVRMDGLGEDQETAEAYCTDILEDPLLAVYMEAQKRREVARLSTAEMRELMITNKKLLRLREINKTRELDTSDYVKARADAEREYEREQTQRPDAGIDEEFGERVYVVQKLLGVPQNYAESHVMSEMILEGKFADVTKRTYSRESVGNLYGKTKEERIAEDYADQPIYSKDAKAREQFQKFEEEQRASGVSMPSDKYRAPTPGRMTVGNLYGKTRAQILKEQQEEERK